MSTPLFTASMPAVTAPHLCAYKLPSGGTAYGSGDSTWRAIMAATPDLETANRIADLCRVPMWQFERVGDDVVQVWEIEDANGSVVAWLFKR